MHMKSFSSHSSFIDAIIHGVKIASSNQVTYDYVLQNLHACFLFLESFSDNSKCAKQTEVFFWPKTCKCIFPGKIELEVTCRHP